MFPVLALESLHFFSFGLKESVLVILTLPCLWGQPENSGGIRSTAYAICMCLCVCAYVHSCSCLGACAQQGENEAGTYESPGTVPVLIGCNF